MRRVDVGRVLRRHHLVARQAAELLGIHVIDGGVAPLRGDPEIDDAGDRDEGKQPSQLHAVEGQAGKMVDAPPALQARPAQEHPDRDENQAEYKYSRKHQKSGDAEIGIGGAAHQGRQEKKTAP